MCPEAVVQVIVSQMNLERWNRQTPQRRHVLLERGMAEQRELQGAVAVSHDLLVGDLAGRTTGTAEWRRARGEMGDEAKTQAAIASQHERKQDIHLTQKQLQENKEEKKDGDNSAPSGSSSALASLSPASSTPSSCVGDSLEAGKREVKLLFSRYHKQLTTGCGRSDCQNEDCKSSQIFRAEADTSAAAIARRCLELTTKYKASKLCDERNTVHTNQ